MRCTPTLDFNTESHCAHSWRRIKAWMDMCVVSHQGVVGQRWADVDDELNEAKLSRLKNKSQHFPLYILLSPKIWIYWRQKFPKSKQASTNWVTDKIHLVWLVSNFISLTRYKTFSLSTEKKKNAHSPLNIKPKIHRYRV